MSLILGLFLLCFTVLIPIGMAALLYWADRYEKEPKRWLVGLFLWGALFATAGSVILSLLGEGIASLMLSEQAVDFLGTSVLAPVIEESWKGLAVLAALLWNREEIHSLVDGLIYGAVVGLGFTTVENVLYLVGALAEGGIVSMGMLFGLRVLLFGFTHGLYTAMTGLGVAAARLYVTKLWSWLAIPAGWMAAVFLHMVHNTTVSLGFPVCGLSLLNYGFGLGVTVAVFVWALRRERRWLARYLHEEWRNGLITEGQYATANSLRRRIRALQQARDAQARKFIWTFYERLSELAYLKAQAARTPEDRGLQQRIQALREFIQRNAPHVPAG